MMASEQLRRRRPPSSASVTSSPRSVDELNALSSALRPAVVNWRASRHTKKKAQPHRWRPLTKLIPIPEEDAFGAPRFAFHFWAYCVMAVTAMPYFFILNGYEDRRRGHISMLLMHGPIVARFACQRLGVNRQRLDVGTTCAFIVGPLIYHVTRAFEVFSSADPCALALAGADALRRSASSITIARFAVGCILGTLALPLRAKRWNFIIQSFLPLTSPSVSWWACGRSEWLLEVATTTFLPMLVGGWRR